MSEYIKRDAFDPKGSADGGFARAILHRLPDRLHRFVTDGMRASGGFHWVHVRDRSPAKMSAIAGQASLNSGAPLPAEYDRSLDSPAVRSEIIGKRCQKIAQPALAPEVCRASRKSVAS